MWVRTAGNRQRKIVRRHDGGLDADQGEIVMPVIVFTRLRLKDAALTDEFFTDAVAALEQAQKSEGNLGTDALSDADNAWWTVTAWQDKQRMRSYVGAEPHRSIMSRLDKFCDEATFVDWEQDSGDLPDWQTGWRRMVDGGTAGMLTQPSPAHQTRDFPAPVVPAS
jgi:quinol monooxygenase YgiN